MKYFLSLGSNIGDKKSNLYEAIFFLRGLGKIIKVSSIYKTSPVKMPVETEYFLNIVVELDTSYTPDKLLTATKKFEKKKGRKKKYHGYESRIIDIDILMANKTIVEKRRLVIPHPELTKRAFVLIPLSEIAPDLVHPVLNRTIEEILADLKTTDTVIKINGNQEIYSGEL